MILKWIIGIGVLVVVISVAVMGLLVYYNNKKLVEDAIDKGKIVEDRVKGMFEALKK